MAVTFTGGTTNRIVTNLTSNLTTLTVAIRYRLTGTSGVARWLYDKGVNSVTNNEYLVYTSAGNIRLLKAFTVSSTGAVAFDFAQSIDGLWHSLVFTHDRSSIDNDAIIYQDGNVISTTRSLVQGSNITTNNAFVFGNRPTNLSNAWNGDLADMAIWNKIVDPAKCLMISDKYSPMLELDGLFYYNRGIATADQDIAGNFTNTVNGTTISDHPPVIYRS